MNTLLAVEGLSVHSIQAHPDLLVNDVAFSLGSGQSLTLLGESGSGKSLLAQAIMGTLPAGLQAAGRIGLNDEYVPADQPHRRRHWWGRHLALLPQEPWSALDPTMRVGAQVAEVHRYVQGRDKHTADSLALAELQRLGLKDGAPHQFPHRLSGGMAQRVAFAATLAGGAPVLIVDEPTKGLDSALRTGIVEILRTVTQAGGAVLVITHDIAVARGLDDQVAVMREARIIERGTARALLASPSHPYTRALVAAEPAAWPSPPPRVRQGDTDSLLEARGLTKALGGRTLFENLDLTIATGERIAVTGASGSGKTSLGNVLLGLSRPDAGKVVRSGRLRPFGMQKLFQDPLASFAPRVSLARSLRDVAALRGVAWPAVEASLECFGLASGLLERLPHEVSGGELQRLALARALLTDPQLLFADEPTSRLDPLTQREIFDYLLPQLDQRGCALLLVTHDLDLASKTTERAVHLPDRIPSPESDPRVLV